MGRGIFQTVNVMESVILEMYSHQCWWEKVAASTWSLNGIIGTQPAGDGLSCIKFEE